MSKIKIIQGVGVIINIIYLTICFLNLKVGMLGSFIGACMVTGMVMSEE